MAFKAVGKHQELGIRHSENGELSPVSLRPGAMVRRTIRNVAVMQKLNSILLGACRKL